MIDKNKLQGPLGWSIAAVLFIGVFSVYAISTALMPLFWQGVQEEATSTTNELVGKHAELVAIDIARFNGRSAFFKPIRKPKPIPPPPPPPPPTPEDEIVVFAPDPAPLNYMGPPLIAIIGEEAWFRGSGTGAKAIIRLSSGEESNGLKLISTSTPAMVTVEHRTGIYVIDLFNSDEPFFLQESPPVTTHDFLEEAEG